MFHYALRGHLRNMSYLGAFSQAFPAGHSAGDAALYSPYYAHGQNGETFYVYSAFPHTHSPELSPGSSEYSPPYVGSPTVQQSKSIVESSAHTRRPSAPPVKNIKRRVTANRKERRRTLSINNAFAELRDCIPNVPADTKLSKIKTLRLATSYIAYLMDVLAQDESKKKTSLTDHSVQQHMAFKTEPSPDVDEGKRKHELASLVNSCSSTATTTTSDRKSRGRTGWPQHVWALELKHENPT